MKRDINGNLYLIKDLLNAWGRWVIKQESGGCGYPSQSAFVSERVDNCNRSTDTFYEQTPDDIKNIDAEINKLPPTFRRILVLEYSKPGNQSTKAAKLGIPQQVFSQRVKYIQEQLNFSMFGA